MRTTPRRHIVWSTDSLDLADPFQRKWHIRQVLLHGRAEDIRRLDLDEVAQLLDELDLPPEVQTLWASFFERRKRDRG